MAGGVAGDCGCRRSISALPAAASSGHALWRACVRASGPADERACRRGPIRFAEYVHRFTACITASLSLARARTLNELELRSLGSIFVSIRIALRHTFIIRVRLPEYARKHAHTQTHNVSYLYSFLCR